MLLGFRSNRSQLVLGLLLCLIGIGLVGCAHYQVGADSLYAPDVHTVYVPMIESDSFRRDLGERLTEAVVKEIELKTPYKVVSSATADSVLNVRLFGDTRRVIGEDPFDAPRVLENLMTAEVSFTNRRRAPLLTPDSLTATTPIRQTSVLIPAAGQTVATAQQQALQRLAEQIVSVMEESW